MAKEFFNHLKLKLLETGPHLSHRLTYDSHFRDHQQLLKSSLSAQSNLSYIIYFNHLAYGDPLFAAHLATLISNPDSPRRLISPASYSHTDPENPKNKSFYKLVQLAQWCGIDVIRVIQAYQVDHSDFGYTPDEAQQTYSQLFKHVKTLKQSDRSVGIILSPEGHRSDTGTLGQFESGILGLGKLIAPVIYIPLGISYPQGYNRESLNLRRPVNLTLGIPTVQQERQDPPDLNQLVERLAITLPTSGI